MKTFVLICMSIWVNTLFFAQDFNYTLRLESVEHDGPGIHSYAIGQHDGVWLIVGGRIDGIHPRQPFASFSATYNNDQLYVLNPTTGHVWQRGLTELSTSLAEQLQSTNCEFYQLEDTLYVIGGYGYSPSIQDHRTHPYLTTIIVSETIEAIQSNSTVAPFIKQIENSSMAVTGGHLARLNEALILVGGHQFDGRYNPMGHQTYTQTYSNAVKAFTVNNSDSLPLLSAITTTTDEAHFHRRDYNLVPQIYSDGSYGHMISSGVFQTSADLPYLYPVEIREGSHTAITWFNQYLSHYHSANVSLYDSAQHATFSIFFGGMSQYYYDGEELIEDDLVPFVKTISMLVRDENDNLEERTFRLEMPGYAGSSAEFVMNEDLEMAGEGLILMDAFDSDSVMIGHIYGGITSSALNPFSANQISLTSADANLYEVWLLASEEPSSIAVHSERKFECSLYPNPAQRMITLNLESEQGGWVDVQFFDTSGRQVHELSVTSRQASDALEIELPGTLSPGLYQVIVALDNEFFTQQSLVIQP